MTTRDDIRGWLEHAKECGCTHLVIVCDTFDWSDYPVQVKRHERVMDIVERERKKPMQKIMEVYALHLDIESQLSEHRAWHYEEAT